MIKNGSPVPPPEVDLLPEQPCTGALLLLSFLSAHSFWKQTYLSRALSKQVKVQ